ncbi:unnamed protein product [Mytilus edulis]|uniref:C2H2-type domain-containing protein n=1 Tax=Mytilus edulis TaxID=6550 RepID=A0A8S3U307_MYTED|nr:unnamed protein product [Mytilus edulis]
MTFFCFHCGAQYNLRSQLTRHVRDKHPKKMLQCRFCSYMVPTSKRFRLIEHEKNVHRHILNPRTKDRELVIPETPTRKPVPTSNFNPRQSCTVTRPRVVTPPTTPILTRSIKPISPLSEISPCSISLGIEDFSYLSPVKKNLVDLFDSPTRQAVEELIEETSIVSEQPTPEPSTVTTTLRDSRHLTLPAIGDEVCPEDRFQAPPSRFQCSYEASKCLLVAEKAKKTGKYTGSVLPTGYGCVKKEEICILPDGTVYKLSATWVPDPSFKILKSKDTQTEELQVQQTCTQTEDKRVVLATTATQTRRVIKKETEVQTEDCRVVVEKETEEELDLDIEEEYMDFDFYH